jgi:hypothetical protein
MKELQGKLEKKIMKVIQSNGKRELGVKEVLSP